MYFLCYMLWGAPVPGAVQWWTVGVFMWGRDGRDGRDGMYLYELTGVLFGR